MTIFLDTNTLLDHILERRYFNEMKDILSSCYDGKCQAVISTASIYTLSYYIQKSFSQPEAKRIIENYLTLFDIIETRTDFISLGLSSSFKDFEDAFQYFTALSRSDIDYFVTGNIKDFRLHQWDSLPVVTPAEFLNNI